MRSRRRSRPARSRAPGCSAGNVARLAGVSSNWGATALTRDPCAGAQLDVEDACQVDQSGLAHAVGRHAACGLDSRAGGYVHDETPEPWCRTCGATAWLSHSAGPRLTSSMSRSVSGVVLSTSPGRNAPMVFTSTSRGRPRPIVGGRRGRDDGVGHLAADIVREVTQPAFVPVDRHDREAAGGEDHRRRTTKPTARTAPPPPPLRSWRHPAGDRAGDVPVEPF